MKDVIGGSEGLVPLALSQNDILTSKKMSAIPHHIEERWGLILHKRASFVPNETERIVQFRSTPSKGSLCVRPGTVWSYILIPSHRTCRHPLNVRLQSQRRTSKGFLAGEFDVLYLMGAIFSLSEKRVFAVAVNHDGFYRILRASVNVKMKAKCTNQIQKVHKRRADMAGVTHKGIIGGFPSRGLLTGTFPPFHELKCAWVRHPDGEQEFGAAGYRGVLTSEKGGKVQLIIQ